MKKILIYICLLFLTLTVKAQVPNPGFEYLNPDFTVSNWGNMYAWGINDSIMFDGYGLYGPSPDAHTGQNAMELRNAMNFTTNEVMVGAVTADTDSVYASWGGVFELFPVTTVPDHLGFYYKYIPVGNDMAMATLAVYDANGVMIGDVNMVLPPAGTYTYAAQPVNYSSPGVPASAFLNFSNAIPGSPANFGTRLVIDDIEINPATAVGENVKSKDELQLFPNPAKTDITIAHRNTKFDFYIYNVHLQPMEIGTATGNTTIPVGSLSPGVYIMQTSDENGVHHASFVVE